MDQSPSPAPLSQPVRRLGPVASCALWSAALALAGIVYGWCPDARIWPARVAILLVVAAAWRSGNRLPIAIVASLAAVVFSWWTLQNRRMTGHIADLNHELSRRDIALAVVALPGYENEFPEKREWHDLPPRIEAALVRRSLARIESAGVPVGDLMPTFARDGGQPDYWQADEMHLTKSGLEGMAAPFAGYLTELGLRPAGDTGKVVLMGNCFAGQFAETLRDRIPGWENLRGLSVRGEMGHAADSLFLFPGEYLSGTRRIVWLLPRATLIRSDLPGFDSTPDLADSVRKTATIRLSQALGWPPGEEKKRLATLPYPNGLLTLSGRSVGTGDFPEGTPIVAIAYGVQDRRMLPLAWVNAGKEVALNLIPLDYHLSQNPKVASEYRLNDSDDLTAGRYWIHSWTLVR